MRAKKTNGATALKPRFQTGDWVSRPGYIAPLVTRVIGCSGPSGKNREFYYELREPVQYGKTMDYTLPEEYLRPATPDEIASVTTPDYPVVTLDKYE